MKKILLPGLAIGAILTGLVIVPLVARGIKSTAVEVYQLTPHAPDAVGVNLDMWNLDTPDPAKTPDYDRQLLRIYGIPNDNKDVLVLIDKSKLVYPAGKNKDGTEKRPDLVFFPVDKQKGEEPLQAKTVDFAVPWVRNGALFVGGILLVVNFMVKRARERKSSAPPPAAA